VNSWSGTTDNTMPVRKPKPAQVREPRSVLDMALLTRIAELLEVVVNFVPLPDDDCADNPLRDYDLGDLEAERGVVESELDRIARENPESWLIPVLRKSARMLADEIAARA
jgi:hypothetical protein